MSDGEVVESLLADYLTHVHESYRDSVKLGSPLKVIRSRDVPALRQESEEHHAMLTSTIHLARLAGDRPPAIGPVWVAGIPGEIADIAAATDVKIYIRGLALRRAEELAAARGIPPTQQSVLWFVAEPTLRALLAADLEELSRVRSVGASKSSVLLAGGILEGVLLDVLSRNKPRADDAYLALKLRSAPTLDRWDLALLVDVASELGILPTSARHLSQALREFRNLVHPGKNLRERVELTEDDARLSFDILNTCIRAVATYEQRQAATAVPTRP